MKEKFPPKTTSNEVKDELAYCEEVITVIENEPKIAYIPAVQEKLNVLKEVVEDYTEQFHYSTDPVHVLVIKQRILHFLVSKHT